MTTALPYVLGIVCAVLYVCAVAFLWLTTGTRCLFCNRRISRGPLHDFHGAPVCERCWPWAKDIDCP